MLTEALVAAWLWEGLFCLTGGAGRFTGRVMFQLELWVGCCRLEERRQPVHSSVPAMSGVGVKGSSACGTPS